MYSNNRKTIGVIVSEVFADYPNVLCKGISARAIECNYNVAFFTNFGSYGKEPYDKGEFNVARLPNYEDLDGLIFVADSISVKGLKENILKQIKNRCHCPVVSIRTRIDELYNVIIDDNTILEEVITHFIEVHGFTRINFLAGPKGYLDSDKRLNTYKRVLREHHLLVEEGRIEYGDFWKTLGPIAVDKWLSGPLEIPQAIVCANDYMAISVCDALEKKGFSVPEDIAVSGCDDLGTAAEHIPSITTSRMPLYDMGMEAVNKIVRHNDGIIQPKDSVMSTKSIYRESCGCRENWDQENLIRRKKMVEFNSLLSTQISKIAYMSSELIGIAKLEELDSRLGYYVYENVGFSSFILCLRKNWDEYYEKDEGRIFSDDEEIIMEVGIKNREDCVKIKFLKREIIPKEFAEDKPMIYYFAVLHHHDNCFGYVGISFQEIQTYMQAFHAWLMNVSNTLENIRIHGELNRLVYELEDMYVRDDLTGLYNRRGLDTIGKNYLDRCVKENIKLMVLTADMDKLKHINDNYGHAKGDIALKLIADALQHAADDDEICVRFGGDEFMVLGIDYDEQKMDRFIHRFIGMLDKFNNDKKCEFNVYVSYGWSLIHPDEKTTMEECMTKADSKMYQQKYEKESKNLKVNLV